MSSGSASESTGARPVRNSGPFRVASHGNCYINAAGFRCEDCKVLGSFGTLATQFCKNARETRSKEIGSHLKTISTRRHRHQCQACGIRGARETLLAFDCTEFKAARDSGALTPVDLKNGTYTRRVEISPKSSSTSPKETFDSTGPRCSARSYFVRN